MQNMRDKAVAEAMSSVSAKHGDKNQGAGNSGLNSRNPGSGSLSTNEGVLSGAIPGIVFNNKQSV